jgi:uncharacterized protein (DUF427 family)
MTELPTLPAENVQSYPRPPALERVAYPLRVVFAGVTIAETTRGLRVLETHHAPTYYIPAVDWADGALRRAGPGSLCEWKGPALYWDVWAGGQVARRAAWSYPNPTPGFADLADHVAVYPASMDGCYVGDERVTPQPGRFYGGWVTSNLRGTVKGGPGTEHW